MSPLLTRGQIIAGPPLAVEEVEVPEWGGTVRIQELTARAKDALEDMVVAAKDATYSDYKARLFVLTAVDEVGDPLFTLDDVPILTQKSAAALDRCVIVAHRLSGLSAAAADAMGKDSGAPQGASSSDSQPSSE